MIGNKLDRLFGNGNGFEMNPDNFNSFRESREPFGGMHFGDLERAQMVNNDKFNKYIQSVDRETSKDLIDIDIALGRMQCGQGFFNGTVEKDQIKRSINNIMGRYESLKTALVATVGVLTTLLIITKLKTNKKNI